jgi:hypothetical protein
MTSNTRKIEFSQFAEYDRQQRAIQRHLLLSLSAGLVLGALGWVLHALAHSTLEDAFVPYGYVGLTVIVGGTAAGLGWALLSSFLAALAPMIATMNGLMMTGSSIAGDPVGGGTAGLNALVLMLVLFGLLAYLARRRADHWGDLAAGLVAGLLMADAVDRATPGLFTATVPGFWPWPTTVVVAGALVALLALRRDWTQRLCALSVALALPSMVALVSLLA